MKSRTRRAFSMSETLMTMGIIGLLAVTMLSMNNFADNKQQIAQTKLTQVDSAIRAWGKAVTQMNETGVGATATISDATTLRASLMNTLNAKSIDPETGVITLDNGAEIKADYTLGDEQARESDSIFATGSALAHIEVSVPNADKNATPLSEDYILQVDKLSSMSDLLEGYTKVRVVEVNGEKRACFDNIAECDITNEAGIHNCKTNPEQCELIDADLYDGNHIYIKNDTTASGCGINTTGSLITYTYITTNGSMYTYEKSTCCDAPKYYAGIDTFTGENICECVKANMTFVAGEYFEPNSNTCAATAPKGYYAIDGDSFPAMAADGTTGYYCDATGLSAPKLCPAGYYCPKKTDNVAGATYGGDDIGSLINPVICPKGYYCPEGSQMPKECPEGHYCPTDGLGEPIACPRGTHQDETGKTECKSCNSPMYQDEVASIECKECKGTGKLTEKNENATMCVYCGLGTYFDIEESKCKLCPAGTYSTVDNNNGCIPCPVGTYQNEEGQTYCKTCPEGTFNNEEGQKSCSRCDDDQYFDTTTKECKSCPDNAISSPDALQCLCKEGHYKNRNRCIACPKNTYKDTIGNATSCTACPENSGTNNKTGSTSITACKCNAGYGTDFGCSDVADDNSCKQVGKGNYSPAYNNCIYACSAWRENSTTKDNVTIASSPNQCLCEPGYKFANNACVLCEENKYKNTINNTSCTYCPRGSVTAGKTGSKSINACICDKGYYKNQNNTCTVCPKNTYKDTIGNATSCTACPENSGTNNKTGSTSITACKCNAGYGTDFGCSDVADDNSCKQVGKGNYSPAYNNCIYACSAWRENSTTKDDVTTASATNQCLCEEGYKLVYKSNKYSCEKCQEGTYKNAISNNACTNCPINTYQDEQGQTSCKNCKADSSTKTVRSKSVDQCLCNAGYYLASTGYCARTDCAERSPKFDNEKYLCKSNQYASAGSSTCQTLRANEYFDDINTRCTASTCPYGYVQNEELTGCKKCELKSCPKIKAEYRETDGRETDLYDKKGKNKQIVWLNMHLNMLTCTCDCPSRYDGYITSNNVLSGGKDEWWTFAGGGYSCSVLIHRSSPLILDLNDDGFKFTSVDEGVNFDLKGTGTPIKISWTEEQTEFDNAFLVLDKNGNGNIDNGTELFGDQTDSENGFLELVKYDTNGDKLITAHDKVCSRNNEGNETCVSHFDNIRLWVDFNKNAKVDYYRQDCNETFAETCECTEDISECYTPELKTLREMHITKISTDYTTDFDDNGEIKKDEHGNTVGIKGWFERAYEIIVDGVTQVIEKISQMIDVFFRTFEVKKVNK